MDGEKERLLLLAVNKFDLSARAYFRLIKVSRTIMDLEEAENIQAVQHITEALQYRQAS